MKSVPAAATVEGSPTVRPPSTKTSPLTVRSKSMTSSDPGTSRSPSMVEVSGHTTAPSMKTGPASVVGTSSTSLMRCSSP